MVWCWTVSFFSDFFHHFGAAETLYGHYRMSGAFMISVTDVLCFQGEGCTFFFKSEIMCPCWLAWRSCQVLMDYLWYSNKWSTIKACEYHVSLAVQNIYLKKINKSGAAVLNNTVWAMPFKFSCITSFTSMKTVKHKDSAWHHCHRKKAYLDKDNFCHVF